MSIEFNAGLQGFNPRTYIRYDIGSSSLHRFELMFQSTYLYKVRPLCPFFSTFNRIVSIHVPI